MTTLAVAVMTAALFACGESSGSDDEADTSGAIPATDIAASSAPLMFHGYPCTVDCSGHDAGYQWAEDHSIDDEDDCGGKSESFIEGCKAYVHENADDTSSSDDSG